MLLHFLLVGQHAQNNEAYLKMLNCSGNQWANRKHFFRVAAQAMRHITIDHARTQSRLKRGGRQRDASLDEARTVADRKPEIILAMDYALQSLRISQPRWVELVELRFFAGLTGEETANALEISLSSVNRDWDKARSWLRDHRASDSEEA